MKKKEGYMATVDYSFKIDSNLKQQAEKVFASLGFNLDTALSIFLKQSVEKQSMPFEIKEEILNDETLEALKSSENDEDIYGPFDSVKQLMESLNA